MDVIKLSDFYDGDTVQSLKKAVEQVKKDGAKTLFIEPGDYIVTGERARAAQSAVMAGDFGENPQKIMFTPTYEYDIGFDLSGLSDVRISAYGVRFIVDGFMEPVRIKNCENVELLGLTVTHKRKPFSRGYVTKCTPRDEENVFDVTVELDEDCPITQKTPMLLRYMWCDALSGRNKNGGIISYTYVDEHHFTAVVKCVGLCVGDEFNTVHAFHSRPAIHIAESKNITLTDVTINSQPGMGVVGNRSENVTLKRLWVVPECGYHWSTNTDATHFTSMTGKLRLENCVFEYHGDDFTNVHGYYQEVVTRVSDTEFFMQEKTPDGTHTQALDYPDVGDTLELTRKSDLRVLDTYKVEKVTPMPDEWMCRVTVDHPLPESTEGLMLADVTRLPFVEIIGCSASSHFARGVLLKTHGALVERNTMRDIHGPAIVAASEAWWYEGVSPRNITIRGNRIVNCGMFWGEAAGIVVKSDCDNPVSRNISDIIIEDNVIEAPLAEHGIYVRGADGVKVSGNIVKTRGEGVVLEDCGKMLK